MSSRAFVWAVVLAAGVGAGCSKSDKGKGPTTGALGVCADSCPRECAQDNDCDVTRGELCCDHGASGKVCQSAASCPRLCTADTQCDTTMSQACVRFSLDDQSRICDLPKNGLRICSGDQACQTGEKCCSIYAESVCLPVNLCPRTCKSGGDCNTNQGEICCTTLDAVDHTLTATGLCIDPAVVTCPRICSQSSQCRTQDGEICCNGICSTSCASKTCNTSNDCQSQICCKSLAGAGGTNGQGGSGGSLGLLPFARAICKPGRAKAMVDWYRAAFRGQWRGRARREREGAYQPITAPTLLIWAMQDSALGYDDVVPGTERYVHRLDIQKIEGCGHFAQQERPREVNRHLMAFLRGAGNG